MQTENWISYSKFSHWTQFWVIWIRFRASRPVSLEWIVQTFFFLRLGTQSGDLHSGFQFTFICLRDKWIAP